MSTLQIKHVYIYINHCQAKRCTQHAVTLAGKYQRFQRYWAQHLSKFANGLQYFGTLGDFKSLVEYIHELHDLRKSE